MFLSGYGKAGQRVDEFTDTIIGDDKKLAEKTKSAFFQQENILTMENGEHDLVEITMQKKEIDDSTLVIMAKAILQNSKLHFLKFVYEVLWRYLIPGSFRLNYCDTDSLCICKFY